jgi:hypothetical protein
MNEVRDAPAQRVDEKAGRRKVEADQIDDCVSPEISDSSPK